MVRDALAGLLVSGVVLIAAAARSAMREGFVTLGLFPENKGRMERLSEEISRGDGARVLLIGRGSRLGDRDHNRRLSRLRAEAVRDRLVALGATPDRVQLLWFGWEPPQIGPEVARAYNLTDAWLLHGEHALTQSVMVVVYCDDAAAASL